MDHWLLLLGVGMWAVMIAVMVFGKRPPRDPAACPTCGHEVGLDGTHCAEQIPDYGGWRQNDQCGCQNDYHWRYAEITPETT